MSKNVESVREWLLSLPIDYLLDCAKMARKMNKPKQLRLFQTVLLVKRKRKLH